MSYVSRAQKFLSSAVQYTDEYLLSTRFRTTYIVAKSLSFATYDICSYALKNKKVEMLKAGASGAIKGIVMIPTLAWESTSTLLQVAAKVTISVFSYFTFIKLEKILPQIPKRILEGFSLGTLFTFFSPLGAFSLGLTNFYSNALQDELKLRGSLVIEVPKRLLLHQSPFEVMSISTGYFLGGPVGAATAATAANVALAAVTGERSLWERTLTYFQTMHGRWQQPAIRVRSTRMSRREPPPIEFKSISSRRDPQAFEVTSNLDQVSPLLRTHINHKIPIQLILAYLRKPDIIEIYTTQNDARVASIVINGNEEEDPELQLALAESMTSN